MRSRDQGSLEPPQNGQCAVKLKSLIVTAAVAVSLTACSGVPFSPSGGNATPAGNGSPAVTQPDASGDCLLGANGADVQVGIADPTSSCNQWIQNLAGTGLNWYPVTSLVLPGDAGTSDGETMQQACDLTNGTEELFVVDAGGQSYGDSICSQEEQNGWTPESTPGPLASDAQQGEQQQAQASASAAAAQASAAASASQASANQQQEQNAQGDVSTLTQDANLSGDVSSVTGDVQSTDGDLATTRSDASQGNGDSCTNASSTVYNDAASTVYNDVLSTLFNDVNTVASDISKVRGDISTVKGDQWALQNAGLPVTPDAASAISAAQAAIASAVSTVNADIDHANGDLDTAYQIADSVGTGSCAGDGPGNPPAGVSHIS
jgi:hypothetical protein